MSKEIEYLDKALKELRGALAELVKDENASEKEVAIKYAEVRYLEGLKLEKAGKFVDIGKIKLDKSK